MSSLKDKINSAYFEAANKLSSKRARRRIVAYVESYDDVFFWRTVLGRFEDATRYFEVMLPSKGRLQRGKKSVLMNTVSAGAGRNMIACVDADYDYLLQGVTAVSKQVISNPYVFHTYVYAIENYQCYAPSLHDVCVMVTLNDHAIFDFNDYLEQYSAACYPLFVWSVWAYRSGQYTHFSLTDFNKVIDPSGFNYRKPQTSIDNVRRKVNARVHILERRYPKAKSTIDELAKELEKLGVTPTNTYLYMQGHHIFDTVVAPIVSKVCNALRQEREQEIYRTAAHHTQMRNEMSCYENSIEDVRSMLKKNVGYIAAPQFNALLNDVQAFLATLTKNTDKQKDTYKQN